MSSETASGEPRQPAGRGDLFILSAPSGAGKTTIIRRLLGFDEASSGGASPDQDRANDRNQGRFGASLYYSVSHTTRDRRPGEVDGRDYFFVDPATFTEMIEADAFFEWADVHGQLKGTAKAPILERLADGIDVLLDVDVQGAALMRERYPAAISVFIMPPSVAELRRRLTSRGLDDEAQIARRIADAAVELRQVCHYDYVTINDRVEAAVASLAAIIEARRHRRERLQPQINSILSDLDAK